jgi:hypothetical protein
MTRLSRLCFVGAALLLAATAGCGGQCNDIGCLDGLVVQFGGTPQLGKTYAITLSTVTRTPEVVPFMRCQLTTVAAGQTTLTCESTLEHRELGSSVQLAGAARGYDNLFVQVALDGVQQSERRFEVMWKKEELNGPGCGVCTSASVDVELR